MRLRYHLAAIGTAVGLCLLVVAMLYYPGGTTESANTVGYSWTHNFLSSLFRPRALNGSENRGRYVAVAAMLMLTASIGVMFKRISTTVTSRAHRKTIEIAGIGAVVYSFLIVTPMHDLMVTISLAFSFVALLVTTHVLYIGRRWRLFAWGALSIALLATAATMYYGNLRFDALPVMQKLSFASCIGWVLAVYYALMDRETSRKPA